MFREYGRGGPTLRATVLVDRGGAGLAVKRGVLAPPRGPIDPAREGVGCKFGCFLNGDSGRGNDGLDFNLSCGLGALAPGPTVCENLDIAGVGGV